MKPSNLSIDMNSHSTGTYIINHTSKISNRGLVLAGKILEGAISIGDLIEFRISDSTRRRSITGIEGIRTSNSTNGNIGLLILCENDDEIIELNDWEPNNEIGKIFKAD